MKNRDTKKDGVVKVTASPHKKPRAKLQDHESHPSKRFIAGRGFDAAIHGMDKLSMLRESPVENSVDGFIPIEPDQLGDPLVLVRQISSQRFEAFFVLLLAGISYRHYSDKGGVADQGTAERMSTADGNLFWGSFFSNLPAHHAIRVVHRGGMNSAGEKSFATQIHVVTEGGSQEAAIQSAKAALLDLRLVLNTVGRDYEFKPVTDVAQIINPSGKWHAHVVPMGLEVARDKDSSVGYVKNVNKKLGAILLPCPWGGHEPELHILVASISECAAPVTVVFTVRPFGLAQNELQELSSVIESLNGGRIKQIRYEQSDAFMDISMDVLDWLAGKLNPWLKLPSGYSLECEVYSSQAVPVPFLDVLGNEIFQGRPVRIFDGEKEVAAFDEMGGHVALDFRNYFHRMGERPALFPSIESLAEVGFEPLYRNDHIKLSDSGILMGNALIGSSTQEVRFPVSDRSRHCYILGATGTGKSTLLYQMIRQDIENGAGVCLIDPHGDLYKMVLEAIPEKRMNQVILVDPTDFEHAVGINFLECSGPYKKVQQNFIVNEMMKIFNRLYDMKHAGGPMFEQYMRNGLMLVMEGNPQGATLMDLPLVFEDDKYRAYLMANCKDPYVTSFWKGIAERASGDYSLSNMGAYICSKLNLFINSHLLRPIIGQPKSTVDFRASMDNKQIVLVNLSKGALGELDTQLLGMVIIGKLFNAALSRAALAVHERKPFYLYVDEFQNFTTDTVAGMLAEARKYGLSLTLANQTMGQLSEEMAAAVLGNVGTQLFFRVGVSDAERLDKFVKPQFGAQDMMSLPDFHAASRMLINNKPSRPFVFKSHLSKETSTSAKKRREMKEQIIKLSRKKYSKPVADVEAEILIRRQPYKNLD
jgi:hypothetical protein